MPDFRLNAGKGETRVRWGHYAFEEIIEGILITDGQKLFENYLFEGILNQRDEFVTAFDA